MPQTMSPYDRERGYSNSGLGVALAFSIGFHVLLAVLFFIVFPSLSHVRPSQLDNAIVVQILGSLAPPAPAAPAAKVNPDLKGPDIVEAPKSESTPSQFNPKAPATVTAPDDVIPLGPKAPEKPPEIKKIESQTPKVTPPKVEQPKPKPKPKPKPSVEDQINRRMRELERKVEAERLDDEIESRVYNVGRASGRGDGEGSEQGGATSGQRMAPEVERYFRHIRDIVISNWVPPAGALSSGITAHYSVKIDQSGHVSSSRLERSSGNPSYDLSVERAINKSSPFPPLPPAFNGGTLTTTFRFNPEELRAGQ